MKYKEYSSDFQFLNNIQYMVLIEEPDATIKFANRHFCEFVGVEPEDIAGRNLFDFVLTEDRASCDAQYMVTPENPHYRLEGRVMSKEGLICWVQFVGSGLFNEEGQLTEFQEVCIDISMWKSEIESKVRKLRRANMQIASALHKNAGWEEGELEKPLVNLWQTQSNDGNTAMYTFDDIVTRSPKMETLIQQAKQIAGGNSSVLIEGESGTGKELFAQSIHNASKRAMAPFVAINCGAIAPELLQSELFGYEEGAFTGALKGGKIGKFEMADGGTIFLDEIGEMPLNQQISLLRILESRTITKIGGNRVIPVNVRIICATNKNLYREVCEGRFRNDLYFRLNVINLRIPPLRERKEDIYPLIQSMLQDFGSEAVKHLTPEQMRQLYRSNWPGNVRELRNVVERIVYMPGYDLAQIIENEMEQSSQAEEKTQPFMLERNLEPEEEKKRIAEALEDCRGNVAMAARELGVSRNTLYKKVRKHGIMIKR